LFRADNFELLGGKYFGDHFVHAEGVPDFLCGGCAVSGKKNQAVDPEFSHCLQGGAGFGARLIAEHKAAETSLAESDPHLRGVAVGLCSRLNAQFRQQRAATEHSPLTTYGGDHTEAWLFLNIGGSRRLKAACQRSRYDGARHRMQ
jgi:hypothetical protein